MGATQTAILGLISQLDTQITAVETYVTTLQTDITNLSADALDLPTITAAFQTELTKLEALIPVPPTPPSTGG